MLTQTFDRLRANGRRAFIPYVTAGHPAPDATVGVLEMLAGEGADVLELGIPFSDPLADGPTIQRATWNALSQGVDIPQVLAWTEEFAGRFDAPIVLFSYLNPILQYGPARFVEDARSSGAAGLLLTDLPLGADRELEGTLAAPGLDLVRLIAPTTARDRSARIVDAAQGFIYYISRRGVTGVRGDLPSELAHEVGSLRKLTDLPVAVGFGISSYEQARTVASLADGVVVGSALVRALSEDGLQAAQQLARTLRSGIDAAVS